MIAEQVAGKATRDALFLSSFSVRTLPAMMAISAVASILAVLQLSHMMLRIVLTVALLPAVVIFGGAFGLAVPGLWSTAILRGGEATHRNSLFRAAYEMLYTPLSEERKRPTKTLIDVGFDRVGTVTAAGIVMVALGVAGPEFHADAIRALRKCAPKATGPLVDALRDESSALALHLDRVSLRLAFKALHESDERLRGTTLEYLETVLPDEVRDSIWPFFGEERPMRSPRSPTEILTDLRAAPTTVATARTLGSALPAG